MIVSVPRRGKAVEVLPSLYWTACISTSILRRVPTHKSLLTTFELLGKSGFVAQSSDTSKFGNTYVFEA
eukprot:6198389-Pleurochrysis_carterae.AAC.2